MALPTDDGFPAFYRAYARTGLHAVATAALTAFGTLTVVHRGFAVVALAAYAVPPLVLYARGAWLGGDEGTADGDERTGAAASEAPPGWSTARSPTAADLHAVTIAGGVGVAAGTDGVVVERDGDGWTVALPDGPGAAGATLHDVDATADGAAVWVVGDGGAVGRRGGGGRWTDHSAPGGDTDNLAGVAATGRADAETVLLVDGSGGVRRGRYRDGELAWDAPTTPGTGSSIAGVALDGETGYLVDTAGDAFRTADGGRSFTPLDLDADGTPTAVAVADCGPAVATTAGVVHLYDGTRWTPERVTDGTLAALAADDGGRGELLAAGDGAVFERDGPGEWRRVAVPAAVPLRGVSVDGTRRAGAVAVGPDGTIVERSGDADAE